MYELNAQSQEIKFNNNYWKFNNEYIKNTAYFLQMHEPTIDCFASSLNTQCNKYISKYNDFTNFAINFFNINKINWANEVALANPPFIESIMLQTIHKYIQKEIKCFLLIPRWLPSIAWKTAKRGAQIEIVFPAFYKLFTPAYNNYLDFVRPPNWNVSLFIFNYSRQVSNYKQLYYNYAKDKILYALFLPNIHKLTHLDKNHPNFENKPRNDQIIEKWKVIITYKSSTKIKCNEKKFFRRN